MSAHVLQAICECRRFMPASQVSAMLGALRGEDGKYFRDKFLEFADRFANMPETYAQDGLGDAAIVYLHYFKGGADWYITEKDSDPDGDGQIQAFGIANLGDSECAELGYISIVELIRHGVELDLYWEPCQLAEVKAGMIAEEIFDGIREEIANV